MSSVLALTVGQSLPVEFKYHKMHSEYYYFVFTVLPFAFLLTLIWTIKRKNTKAKNWTIGFLTVLSAGLCFFILVSVMFSIGFGTWTNETILYRNKDSNNTTINQQIFDAGALGYGGHRIAQLTPFLKYFQTVKLVDTAKIDKTQWIFVNEEGDIHYP
ncbi:MAG TPA: hypothetical protein VLC98_06045 [Phnomibacter sp.]|nr:hypothetical protein [Phnomibacter sp.]